MQHDFNVRIVSTGEYSGCLFVVDYQCGAILHCDECWVSQFRWGTWEKAKEYIALIKPLPNFREG